MLEETETIQTPSSEPALNIDVEFSTLSIEQNCSKSSSINKSDKFTWTKFHTGIATFAKWVSFINGRTPFAFAAFFATGMGISVQQFAYILFCAEIASITAAFLGPLFDGWSLNIFLSFWFVMNGISSISMALPKIVTFVDEFILLMIFRFIYGFGFSLSSGGISGVAGTYCHDSKRAQILGILEGAWPIAGITLIGAGYMIELVSWWSPFVILGMLYFPVALLFFTFYPKENKRNNDYRTGNNAKSNAKTNVVNSNASSGITTQHNELEKELQQKPGLLRRTSTSAKNALKNAQQDMVVSLKRVGTDKRCLLFLFGDILLRITQGSYLTLSSLWFSETYGESSSGVGWVAVVSGLGELTANIMFVFYFEKFNAMLNQLWLSWIFFLITLIVLVLALIFGDKIGGIGVGYVLWGFLNWAHELLFTSGLPLCVDVAPDRKLATFVILLYFALGSVGRGTGAVITPAIWEEYQLTGVFSVYVAINLIAACLQLILYKWLQVARS